MNRKELDDTKKYYVYGLYDPNEKHPFYVGKGTGNRKNAHLWESEESNPKKQKKISKIENPKTKIIYGNLEEAKAYDIEWFLIHWLKVQPKCNLTNKNEKWGAAPPKLKGEKNPHYGKKFTNNKGKNNPMFGVTGENHPRYGKTHSKETKRKISEAQKGTTLSEEAKKKVSDALMENHPLRGVTGEDHPLHGTTISEEQKEQISKSLQGENHHSSKLTEQEAGEVKWLARHGDIEQQKVAKIYGISKQSVTSIKKGRNWEHADPQPVSLDT